MSDDLTRGELREMRPGLDHLTYQQRYLFNVDVVVGPRLNAAIDRCKAVYRSKGVGAKIGVSAAIAVLLDAFDAAKLDDERIFRALSKHQSAIRTERFARLDRRNAERTERRKLALRGENAKPLKGRRNLRKTTFASDEAFEAAQLPQLAGPELAEKRKAEQEAQSQRVEEDPTQKRWRELPGVKEAMEEAIRKNEQLMGITPIPPSQEGEKATP